MRPLLVSALSLLAVGITHAAPVIPDPFISLYEDGTGTLAFTPCCSGPLPGVLAQDPGPGGLALALTFDLLGPPGLVAGDVILSDVGGVYDVIRFNPAGTPLGYPASAVYYAVAGGGLLANTGLPGANYANQFSASSTRGVTFIYFPTATQPGYVPGFTVLYSFGVNGVPEPGTFGLMLAAG